MACGLSFNYVQVVYNVEVEEENITARPPKKGSFSLGICVFLIIGIKIHRKFVFGLHTAIKIFLLGTIKKRCRKRWKFVYSWHTPDGRFKNIGNSCMDWTRAAMKKASFFVGKMCSSWKGIKKNLEFVYSRHTTFSIKKGWFSVGNFRKKW